MNNKAIAFVDYQAHVHHLEVRVYEANATFKTGNHNKPVFQKLTYLQKDWGIESENQQEAIHSLTEMKLTLQKYLNVNPFYKIWDRFKHEIEAEIVRNNKPYSEESLFHDVMIATTGHEISLDCVYQSLKLTNGETYAAEFKKEMLSNIEWLDRMVNMNYSEYEDEAV